MKFKILPGSKLFDTLTDVNNGMIAARAAITDTLKAMGYTGQYASSMNDYYLVHCNAVRIEFGKPDGWKCLDSGLEYYWPKAKNKAALAQLEALPAIKVEAINNPLKFSFGLGEDNCIYHRPAIAWHKKYILIDTGSMDYKPVKGMTEILESEYKKLLKAIKEPIEAR